MEEADVLCNRIGIVSDGILRCVAPQVRLKSIYGGGYHLFINCQKGKVLQLIKQIKKQKAKEDEKKKAAEDKVNQSSRQHNYTIEEGKKQSFEVEEEDDGVYDDETIIQRVSNYIKDELPHSILIREFNGNFVYQVNYYNPL